MPKLRSLSGKQVVKILSNLGFEVVRIKGSHHRLEMPTESGTCKLTVPVHGKKALKRGTLRSIYKEALNAIPEDDLKPHFYGD